MASINNPYEIKNSDIHETPTYFFVSEGKQTIVKAIQYSYVQQLGGRPVYNLGFGDYDFENENLDDSIDSNNGDHYRIFDTVLSTIPTFFTANNNAFLMVYGSDGSNEFMERCKQKCVKKCGDECRKLNRRIAIYRSYVNKHFASFSVDYEFFGGVKTDSGEHSLERYILGKSYDSILLYKKNV